MLLWILLLGGLALVVAAVGLFLAMGQAEKRARRTLFRALGLPEDTVELLMSRNGDVLAELALVRRQDMAAFTGGEPAQDDAAASELAPQRAPPIRLVHPINGAPAPAAPPPAEAMRPGGGRRRLQLPGRQSRP